MERITWRERAAVLIYEALRAHPKAGEKEIRLLLRQLYPWGERRGYAYKAWRQECRALCPGSRRPVRPRPLPGDGLPLEGLE